MKIKSRLFKVLFGLMPVALLAQPGPYLSSWLYNSTGMTGQHWEQGQNSVIVDTALADVRWIGFTSSDVYIRCSGVPAYAVGPFLDGNPVLAPTNRHYLFRIPRNPVKETQNPVTPGLGHIGVLINGVPVYNFADAMSYNNQGVWHQNAVTFEHAGMDCGKGHPAPVFNGPPGPGSQLIGASYHHHQSPAIFTTASQPLINTCATYPSLGLYTMDSTVHSPLLGFAFDGFPIYGAYAYSDTVGLGSIRRIQSSYRMRTMTTRTTLPDGTILAASQFGPSVSSVALGSYKEDFEYISGLGDLDEHNGRFAVTPEFPNGTYAYYTTVNAQRNSAYPYVIGDTYYGAVATDNFGGMGPNAGATSVVLPGGVSTFTPLSLIEGAPLNLTLYPIPTLSSFTLQGQEWQGTWEIVDLMGRVWNRGFHQAQDGNLKGEVGLMPSGYYRLNVHFEGQSLSIPMYVVQN
ncbi:MAG: YHYH protein [Schleiferiaceae bacterium]|nr:YHYH protein [Schleiferiaceae bacterium]